MSLKMFVWDNVLTDYTDGMICILANDLAEAYRVLAAKEGVLSFELEEARNHEPKIYEEPFAAICWGGG